MYKILREEQTVAGQVDTDSREFPLLKFQITEKKFNHARGIDFFFFVPFGFMSFEFKGISVSVTNFVLTLML